ncbi:MAG: hypothetical protein AB8E15_12405 [Bdellovibrionales bacterium]
MEKKELKQFLWNCARIKYPGDLSKSLTHEIEIAIEMLSPKLKNINLDDKDNIPLIEEACRKSSQAYREYEWELVVEIVDVITNRLKNMP